MTKTADVVSIAGQVSGVHRRIQSHTQENLPVSLITVNMNKVITKMKEYDFILKFSLPDANKDPSDFIDALAEAGCDDATIGIGKKGRIALDFCRESNSAEEALKTAIEDVKSAIPGAVLIEASPDLVGVSEIAHILNVTRQNITKHVSKLTSRFPTPIHEGSSQLWHLTDVIAWSQEKLLNTVSIANLEVITEVARESRKINIEKELNNLRSLDNLPTYH